MLDTKNITKYISINEKMIIAGQSSGGIWYIKELPVDNTNELDNLIGECNKICNKYNQQSKGVVKNKKTTPIPPKKTKKPEIKGME